MQETTKNALFALFQAQNETAKAKTLKEIEAPILPPVKSEITQPQPQPETPKTPVAIELEYIHIIWHEGSANPDYTNSKFKTWTEVQEAFLQLWNANEKGNTQGGYTKVKTNIKFLGMGAEQVCRIDLTAKEGNGDFNPTFETLQKYLSTQFLEPHEYFTNDKEELSTLTFNDLITPQETPKEETASPTETPIIEQISNFIEAVKPTEEAEQKPRIFISFYSKYSIAVTGETKQIKEVLKDLGGVYNRYLKCGAGWIFAKRKEAEILEELKLYANF
jgi:hypothetical protein